jgi:hypothetical protein
MRREACATFCGRADREQQRWAGKTPVRSSLKLGGTKVALPDVTLKQLYRSRADYQDRVNKRLDALVRMGGSPEYVDDVQDAAVKPERCACRLTRPDGLILVEALIVSVLVAVLAWRRRPPAGITAVVATVVHWRCGRPEVLVPRPISTIVSAALFGRGAERVAVRRARAGSRVTHGCRARGAILFVGCYVGICELCEDGADLISC